LVPWCQLPGANFSNGTGAKHFHTLALVPNFEWHLVPHLCQIGTGAGAIGTGAKF